MTKRSDRRPHLPAEYRQRTYRRRVGCQGLLSFRVVCQETDLMIQADGRLEGLARERTLACRGHIERYIEDFPGFATTLAPWPEATAAPEIVRRMIQAGRIAGVGPMAAVAGAIAETVGRSLLEESRQVVVENGGDLFISTEGPVVVGLFAGDSPLSMKMGIRIMPSRGGIGVCTSSGTVGHSRSAGLADAVCVISRSCALADAAATAIGNQVRSRPDVEPAIASGRKIAGVLGIVVVIGRQMGAWGQVELVPLSGKKG